MTELSQEILQNYQVRKTKAQKAAFIELMRKYYPEIQVETGGFPKSRNLVIGDVAQAKVVFTAHYDTCAVLPFPNFITPRNIPFYILYNLLVVLPLVGLMFFVMCGVTLLTDSFLAGEIAMCAVLIAFMWVLIGGRPNRHTVNDNTSGVLTLCETLEAMTPEERQKAAFVFFDLEEAGLFGSAFFAKKHKAAMRDKLLVNFDCVSDGDNLLIIRNKKARTLYDEAIRTAFAPVADKNVLLEKAATTVYPSDQAQFPCHVGIAALKKKPFIGLYMDKIHTKHDTVLDERNIEYFRNSARRLTNQL